MSGIDDCASQEIEASTSSNSTRNSKKCTFVQSILKRENSQTVCSPDLRIILPAERVPRLPQLEKRDFIQNWIIAHSKPVNSPEESYPGSPVLGISPAKRSPQSPILGYRWKRVKREASSKENCRVSLSKKFQQSRPQDSPATTRVKIERENSQCSQSRERDFLNDDSDKTLISTSSPVLNGITNSPVLNAGRVSGRKSWLERTNIPGKFDADSTLKCVADRRSLVRDGSKVPEALSLSSPLCARNKSLKIENTTDEPNTGGSVENLSKRSFRFSDILVEDSPFDAEIMPSFSKIPESPSVCTTIDDYEGLAVDSRGRNSLEINANVVKSEHFSISPINHRTKTSFNHDRRSQDRESSIISDSLSIVSPLGKNKKTSSSSSRATSRHVKSEAVEISQGCLRKIHESLELPDTLSVSSHFADDLVPESSSSANHSLCSTLEMNGITAVKSVNSSVIKATNSPVNLKTFAGTKCVGRLTKIRESLRLSKNSSERIDFDSNAPEDDIKIESDSDATISDFIENPESQNLAAVESKNLSRVAEGARLADVVERVRKPRDDSCDSDETHYSDGEPIARLPIPEGRDPKNSQQISQTTSNSHEGRVSANRSENRISQAASPMRNDNSERPANVSTVNMTSNGNNKKKKKGKKGSLVAKLQTIVSSQVSNLRIWRYQMSQANFRNSSAQFVALRIRERETRYGRHYLLASVIEDSNGVLRSLFESSSERSESSEKIKILTLVMIPEIIGVVKIRPNSELKIYPPWEIIDPAKKILNVTFFNVSTTEEDNVACRVNAVREETRIIEDFDCPCIRAEKLVDSCRVKFTNTKPSIMQAMFGS